MRMPGHRNAARRLSAIAMIFGLFCLGCSQGPKLGKVSGKLTYKGEPVKYAAIEFNPIGAGKGSLGWTDEEGEYTAEYVLSRKGALLGEHRVTVRVYPQEGDEPIPVPAKYGSKSEVVFEVQPGKNRLDIELDAA
ncbi:MAG: hypothetical protein AAGF97_05220 [Planctomycetota bacterium]